MTTASQESIGERLAELVEHEERLDGLVATLSGPAEALIASPARRSVLLGRQLGHAVHPILTDVPVGMWMSTWALDVLPVPGSRRAAQRLVGLGALAAIPTALTGWAEWARVKEREDRRTGVVHAGANAAALVLFTGSWLARRSGRQGTGVVLGQLGTAAVAAGGFLGGHLAIGRKVGSSVSEEGYQP